MQQILEKKKKLYRICTRIDLKFRKYHKSINFKFKNNP